MKKSQITIFMVLGLVILIIAIGLIYFTSSLKSQDTENKNEQVSKSASDIKPVTNYIKECLKTTAKEGLFLLAEQSGYIFESQGGPVKDPISDSSYIDYNDRKVRYLIQLPVGARACKSYLPDYPTANHIPYPYDSDMQFEHKEYYKKNCFGKRITLTKQKLFDNLAKYIENNLDDHCDLSVFTNYNFDLEDPTIDIKDRQTQTDFIITYPMVITNINTDTKTSMDKFSFTLPMSISALTSFVNDIMLSDVSDPTYNIVSHSYSDDFSVFLYKDIKENDDIMEVKSDSLRLDGKPFSFVFARKNRYPVLEYIYNHSFDGLSFSDRNLIWPIRQELMAQDPDEDNVTLAVFVGQGNARREWVQDTSYTLNDAEISRAESIGSMPVKIEASDKQYTDYQEFQIT